LPSGFTEVLNRPEYTHSHWGILFVDADTGESVYSWNADKWFAPASVTKLFSCAAALEELGPEYRFATRAVRNGTLSGEGILDGDLVLVAGGDLTLGGRTDRMGRLAFCNVDHTYANWTECTEWTEPDLLAGLNELAALVRRAGVKQVRGVVRVDDRRFERSSSSGSGPTRVSPWILNDNVIDVKVSPSEPGRPALVEMRPKSSALVLEADVLTTTNGVANLVVQRDSPGRIKVRGTIPANSKPVVKMEEVEDPAGLGRVLYSEALVRAGVRIDVPVWTSQSPDLLPSREEVARLPEVAVLRSVPFRENLRVILKTSHNLHASTLPLLLAVQHGERTLEAGMRFEGLALRRLGVPIEDLSFGGGAGGTRSDFVSPRATVALLKAMRGRPEFEVFRDALPVLGRDGTLAKISTGHPAAGAVQAKTGTLGWENLLNDTTLLTSKSLAGYVQARSGKRLVFAVFVNGVPHGRDLKASREGEALGRLCEVAWELN
jgi:D-alanyl-D-alanine carboxypeptidase/D-alanyl-D-alanine-endopeptidase (penicillin-binding protein 4)